MKYSEIYESGVVEESMMNKKTNIVPFDMTTCF